MNAIDAPAVMLYFAFIASLILTLLKIGEIIYSAIKRPTLNLRLTKDAFFRLCDWGESLFCTPVLLASNGPLLIVDAKATLIKVDEPKKQFQLEILAFGEKVRGTNIFADHHFTSRSPLTYISESMPYRAVYLCVPKDYRAKVETEVTEFRNSILKYKTDTIHSLANASLPSDEVQLKKQIVNETERLIETALGKLMDYVQLEAGKYKFTLTLEYKSPSSGLATRIISSFTTEKSKATSSITFSVGQDVRDTLRTGLRQTLTCYSQNLLFDRTDAISYPEYQPFDIMEQA